MSSIDSVRAREILDSRGLPTIEVDVTLTDGTMGRASVPSGKSTGSQEAFELRDGDAHRFAGKGVLKAIRNVEDILQPGLRGMSPHDQQAIDSRLIEIDATTNKSRLGANALLGCSLAVARAAARVQKAPLARHLANLYDMTEMQLPVPMMNVINGGKHADSGICTQEFMLVPHGAPDLRCAVRMGAETYQALQTVLQHSGYRVSVGDEGGFAPQLATTSEALEILMEAIVLAGYRPGEQISIALDFAANNFYHNGRYVYEGDEWTANDMIDYCLRISEQFPIVSIEDPLDEGDWDGWIVLTKRVNEKRLQCVGDDIFVTNQEIVRRGIAQGVANAVLIKPNQIGTLSETIDTMRLAQESGYRTVMSHRSGETDDAFIADLAVATHVGQMKSGAPARGERVAKYNQLMRLQDEFEEASFAGSLY